MKFKEQEFMPVIFGNDINVYSLARAFYEAYGVASHVFGKATGGPAYRSKLITFTLVPDIDESPVFLKRVNDLAAQNPTKKLVLMGCGDNYVKSISVHRPQYLSNVIAPCMDFDVLEKLIEKESFYTLCDKHGISYPKTVICTKEKPPSHDFMYPVILKPSDSVSYFAHDFEGQKKVYRIGDKAELDRVFHEIYASGYDNSLILQEYIPGDDSNLRIIVNYSGQDGKVKLMALGHGLLEEHTPKGIGNLSLIYLDNDQELTTRLTDFLNDIGFVGFSSFDLKFDVRDGQYKVFELNGRQPRSNYYVTAAGCNIVTFLIDDVIFNKNNTPCYPKGDRLWSVVPKGVAFRYVKNPTQREKLERFYREKKVTHPLFLKGDNNPLRFLSLWKNHLSQYKKYKTYLKDDLI